MRHYWPAVTFFTTTDGKGACNPPYAAADGVTFGSGQIGAAVIAGFNDDASEYGTCSTPLPNRTIALYR